eukprot:CAMPEP_0201531812 /NCGR_PEP_ID=MMETSP0161_2-20130828/48705_1 /ASSEMBLY_ACC=CAM_ASM_000251 /TAXON_ID=180227 /ORGANISM="Neoparamoeba aestuarina, Strain SoJaBio B1-5/56/2" /LENGTH=93 /DNA_ID=CAMNT_0047934913 /DNA_START=243 /DNA_END=521 /DNA_ORIENTATION=-
MGGRHSRRNREEERLVIALESTGMDEEVFIGAKGQPPPGFCLASKEVGLQFVNTSKCSHWGIYAVEGGTVDGPGYGCNYKPVKDIKNHDCCGQ